MKGSEVVDCVVIDSDEDDKDEIGANKQVKYRVVAIEKPSDKVKNEIKQFGIDTSGVEVNNAKKTTTPLKRKRGGRSLSSSLSGQQSIDSLFQKQKARSSSGELLEISKNSDRDSNKRDQLIDEKESVILIGLQTLHEGDSTFHELLKTIYIKDDFPRVLIEFERAVLSGKFGSAVLNSNENLSRKEHVISVASNLFKYETPNEILLLVKTIAGKMLEKTGIILLYISHIALLAIKEANKRKSSLPRYQCIANTLLNGLGQISLRRSKLPSSMIPLPFMLLETVLLMDYYSGDSKGLQMLLVAANKVTNLVEGKSVSKRPDFFEFLADMFEHTMSRNDKAGLNAIGQCWVVLLNPRSISLGLEESKYVSLFQHWVRSLDLDRIMWYVEWCCENLKGASKIELNLHIHEWERYRLNFGPSLIFLLSIMFWSKRAIGDSLSVYSVQKVDSCLNSLKEKQKELRSILSESMLRSIKEAFGTFANTNESDCLASNTPSRVGLSNDEGKSARKKRIVQPVESVGKESRKTGAKSPSAFQRWSKRAPLEFSQSMVRKKLVPCAAIPNLIRLSKPFREAQKQTEKFLSTPLDLEYDDNWG